MQTIVIVSLSIICLLHYSVGYSVASYEVLRDDSFENDQLDSGEVDDTFANVDLIRSGSTSRGVETGVLDSMPFELEVPEILSEFCESFARAESVFRSHSFSQTADEVSKFCNDRRIPLYGVNPKSNCKCPDAVDLSQNNEFISERSAGNFTEVNLGVEKEVSLAEEKPNSLPETAGNDYDSSVIRRAICG